MYARLLQALPHKYTLTPEWRGTLNSFLAQEHLHYGLTNTRILSVPAHITHNGRRNVSLKLIILSILNWA